MRRTLSYALGRPRANPVSIALVWSTSSLTYAVTAYVHIYIYASAHHTVFRRFNSVGDT